MSSRLYKRFNMQPKQYKSYSFAQSLATFEYQTSICRWIPCMSFSKCPLAFKVMATERSGRTMYNNANWSGMYKFPIPPNISPSNGHSPNVGSCSGRVRPVNWMVPNFSVTGTMVSSVGDKGSALFPLVLDQASRTVWMDCLKSSGAALSVKTLCNVHCRKP